MADRDKLADLICSAEEKDLSCPYIGYEGAVALADHILADGWIKPPCKMGQTVYVLRSGTITPMVTKFMYVSSKVNRIYAENGSDHYNFRQKEIGKSVFFNYDDAVAKAKECVGND